MKRFISSKKYSRTSVYVLIFLIAGFLVSGCRTFDTVKADQVNIPGKTAPTGDSYQMVYAISNEIKGNHMTIRQLGIFPEDEGQVRIRYGLAATLNMNEMNNPYHSELDQFLQLNNYHSIEDLISDYQSAKPISPDSRFVVLPDELGQRLFTLVKKIDDWEDWISRKGISM